MSANEVDLTEEVVATSPELVREQALRRLKKRRDFRTHAFVYLLVNLMVWGIWLVIGLSSHSWWPWRPRTRA